MTRLGKRRAGQPDPGLFKPSQVAALVGVHPAMIRKLANQGRLKPIWVGSQRRFSIAEVRRLIAERMLGHRPRTSKETSEGIIRWARWKLGLPSEPA